MRVVLANDILRAQLHFHAGVDAPVVRPFGLYANASDGINLEFITQHDWLMNFFDDLFHEYLYK